MDKFIRNKDTDQPNQQIRISPSYLYGSFIFCAFCLLAAALSQEDRWIFIGVALLALSNGFLTFRNDRVEYNKKGITLHSILGKPFHKSWSDILNIRVVEEPLISKRLYVGRVLQIKCMEKNGSCTTIYRFPYRYYIGIDAFLAFSASCLSNGNKQRRDTDI